MTDRLRDNRVIDALRDGGVRSDPWGSFMSLWFDVAAELHHRGEDVPDEWQYSPSPAGGDIREHDSWGFDVCVDASAEDLIQAGDFCKRVCDRLRAAGRDY